MDKQEDFVKAIIIYGKETDLGNSRKINRAFDKFINAYVDLKQNKDVAISLLNQYLNNENDYVSMICASFLLEFEEDKAIKKLEEISKRNGFCAFEAEITLEEWKKGALKFPPY